MAAAAKRKLTRRQTTRLLSGAALVALVIALFLLAQASAPPDPARAFPGGEIVFGVDASYPPFAWHEGDALTGLDIELARAIAGEIGLPPRFETLSYYGLYDALISGKVDVLISALSVDTARMNDVRYTQRYFDNGLVLVVDESAEAELDALAGGGIAFEYASSADSLVRAWLRDGRRLERLPYEWPDYALDALRLAQADAALVDATTYLLYRRRQGDWRSKYAYVTQDHYALALRRDRHDSWKLVDGALTALNARGELDTILARWL